MKKTLLIMLGAGLILASCGQEKKGTEKTDSAYADTEMSAEAPEVVEQATPTIVGVAAGNENFSTLVAAVKGADLVETLNSAGPFTVFAPTNAAFAKLPKETVPTLLKVENKKQLTNILTYHVVSGKFMAADVVKAIKAGNGSFSTKTVMGENITLMLEGENVVIKDASGGQSVIIMTDVAASNGVIHAIDSVIMPKM